jgi:hypothetical protein
VAYDIYRKINMYGELIMADIYPTNPGESDSTIERNAVFSYVRDMLADGMVEVELDPKHYETALDRALSRFRQRSSAAVEESYMFLELVQDQNEYRLPNEVIEVQSIFRRAIGSRSGLGAGGTLFEPFNLAYTNTYLLSGTMMGGLATYELFAGYQKLVGRMFGAFIEFKWRQSNHMLTILQRPFAQGEQVLLRTHNYRPDFVLLQDIYAKQWLRDYTLAVCKLMLGEARSKFGSIAGPGSGGITLNGTALLTAGTAELEKLDKELVEYVSGGTPMTFVIG